MVNVWIQSNINGTMLFIRHCLYVQVFEDFDIVLPHVENSIYQQVKIVITKKTTKQKLKSTEMDAVHCMIR